jgi:hypothetical protein
MLTPPENSRGAQPSFFFDGIAHQQRRGPVVPLGLTTILAVFLGRESKSVS